MGPVILMVYMVQQINCIKNRKGEIIEVLDNFYSFNNFSEYDYLTTSREINY